MTARDAVVVVPCYNEADRLPAPAFADFARRRADVGFLFVDDGSSDGTYSILENLCAGNPDGLSVLRLPKNVGKGEAVRRGALEAWKAAPAFVGYWDADLSAPLESVLEFLRILRGNASLEAVFGSRVMMMGCTIRRNAWRHYPSRAFITIADLLMGVPLYDSQCGAKLFRATPLVRTAFEAPFSTRWIFDWEIIARLQRERRKAGRPSLEDILYESPLPVWRDVPGSKMNFWDFLKVFAGIFFLYWRYRRRSPGDGA